MLALGTSICVLLLRARGRQIARMYAADLAGAAVGALLAVPLLHGLSTPCVVAALGVLPLLAASSPARAGTCRARLRRRARRLGRLGHALSAPLCALLCRGPAAPL